MRLIILVDGVASRAGAILTTGASWGDILISSARLRDTRPAKALTFCELVVLGRDALERLMPKFPPSARSIRHAALKLATQRMITILAMYAKLQQGATATTPPMLTDSSGPAGSPPPRSGLEAKGQGKFSSPIAEARGSPGGNSPDCSPSAMLLALQSPSKKSPASPQSTRPGPLGLPSLSPPPPPSRASGSGKSLAGSRGGAAAGNDTGTGFASGAEFTDVVGPAEVVSPSAVMARLDRMEATSTARLDRVEATMQLMLQMMVERNKRDAASRSAWLQADGHAHGNSLAA